MVISVSRDSTETLTRSACGSNLVRDGALQVLDGCLFRSGLEFQSVCLFVSGVINIVVWVENYIPFNPFTASACETAG